MTNRDIVLAKIRRHLGVSGGEPERRQAVALRIEPAKPNLIPKRGQLPHPERVALFCAMAEKAAAGVTRLASPDEVPEAVADLLRRRNFPLSVRLGDDPRLAALDWRRAPALECLSGPSDGTDLAGLSHAFAGVAESGTLVLVSGPDNPSTINFLPEVHFVVLSAADIAGDYEAVWARLRERYGTGAMPRTVNLVTGPSRSADIEQTLLMGAHGPRALEILVVGA